MMDGLKSVTLGGEIMFRKSFWICVLALLVMMAMSGLVDIDHSYAHGKIIKKSDEFLSEAHFYGVPTFGIEPEPSKTTDQELEVLKSRFWGIPVQSIP